MANNQQNYDDAKKNFQLKSSNIIQDPSAQK